MIHATDIARAIGLLATKTAFDGEVYNLASGVRVTIREMAEELIRAFGVDVPWSLRVSVGSVIHTIGRLTLVESPDWALGLQWISSRA